MKGLVALLIILLYANLSVVQGSVDSVSYQVENYLLQGKNDSALTLLPKVEDADYRALLKRLASERKPSYIDQRKLVKSVRARGIKADAGLQPYLEEIELPSNTDTVNLAYVELRNTLISNLRNENEISEANKLNQELEQYILRFDQEDRRVIKAKILTKVHGVILYSIQNKGKESVELALELLQEARALPDTVLMIMLNHYLYTSYKMIGDLGKSIAVAERAKELDEARQKKSAYYYENLFMLMDAYMYKGGYLEEVSKLIRIVYLNESSRLRSFEMIARYLEQIVSDKEEQEEIFQMLGVKDIVEFSEFAISEVENVIYDNDYYYFLNACAFALEDYGEYGLAMRTLVKSVRLTRKIYGEDLSKSLAEYEANQVRREKELELTYEKEKSSLYILILVLAVVLLLISIYAFAKKRKQAILLEEKNQEVEVALHEKQLLLKEVHHRVKNNFQIVSSLLELQSKGIEDEKAKELAQEGRNRVKSMALIHQKLYQNDDLLIHFEDYIDKLIKEISNMYSSNKRLNVSVEVPNIKFDIDTAIPLGLIINELVTNAFKYGLSKEGSQLNVSIKEEEEEQYCLEVKDDGVGLPVGFDLSKTKSMGLRLVKSLSKQLHGRVNYENNNGAVFKIWFKSTLLRNLAE